MPGSRKSLMQFVRYMLVGAFNTGFGYGVFALLIWSLGGLGAYSYLYAAALANLVAITVAFLGYKWFVFRTRGNYLIEWARCVGVYGSSAVISLLGISVLVPVLRAHSPRPSRAPYIAGAIMTVVTIIVSFFGHKNISFRQKLGGDAEKNSSLEPFG